jgi:CRISPR/Cas system-associated exonuclease Cas4 (RecB family)
MTAPAGALLHQLQFSQGSLQDFVDCRRKFYLRHILRLAWPTIPAEPANENERLTDLGKRFHRLVQQFFLGLPVERLRPDQQDGELCAWWANFERSLALSPPPEEAGIGPGMKHNPEVSLAAPLDGFILLARYDLLITMPGSETPHGRMVIYDWKTSRTRPRRVTLGARLQTRLYPYLLVRAGAYLNGGRIPEPDQVEMVYWFAAFPDQPERFPYTSEQYSRDEHYLSTLLSEVQRADSLHDFPVALQEDGCRFCVYRSLCNRGQRAGDIGWMEEGEDVEVSVPPTTVLDFEQAIEIAY